MKLSEIAEKLGGQLVGGSDPVISGAAGLEDAREGDLTFVTRKALLPDLEKGQASAAIIAPGMDTDKPAIVLDNPYAGFALFLEGLQCPRDRVFPPGVHETAVVHPEADVSEAASIGPFCVVQAGAVVGKGSCLGAHVCVGPDVRVGQDCLFYAGVILREGTLVANRVILHTGVRLGTDGFGFLPGPGGLQKIPQVGIVVIEDDVELGSNTCVDRATTGRTVIGQGTKLDNLVQIGHNVKIGTHCVISGHCGIAGSCEIGHGVAMGGFVGMGDHLKIGDGAKIGGKSGITQDIPAGATVFGTPAIDNRESFRLFSALRRLPDLIRRVRNLEKQQADSGE